MNLIIGIAIGFAVGLCLCFLYFKLKKTRPDGAFEINGSNYKLVLFDPIDEWEEKEHLYLKVTHVTEPDISKISTYGKDE